MNREAELEYNRWQILAEEANAVGIDPNKPKFNKVFRAIALWGEALSDLRHTQTEKQRDKARSMAIERYNAIKRKEAS